LRLIAAVRDRPHDVSVPDGSTVSAAPLNTPETIPARNFSTKFSPPRRSILSIARQHVPQLKTVQLSASAELHAGKMARLHSSPCERLIAKAVERRWVKVYEFQPQI
jgi:hypothetical protein